MADRIKGITIKIGGDTSELSSALKDVTADLRATQNSLKDVNKLLKLDPGNVTLLTQKQEALSKATDDVKERLAKEKEALEQMKNSDGFDKNSEQAKALERQIIADEQELKKLTEETKRFGSVGAQQVAAVGTKMEEIGGKISGVGDKMTKYVTTPVVGLGAAAVKITADFDSAMSQVQAISGATGTDFDALRDKAREMGAQTKFSATESAEAMNYMAMAGWEAEDMLNGIEGIMNLAAASGEELALTSDIVTDGLTAFGMSAKDSGRFADVMAAAAANANTNVALMGETFKYAGPVAGALGYSIEDVAIATGLMGNAGIKGSMAGTTLRNIFQRMAKPTDEVASAMDRLGVALYDDEGRMYSFQEIMDQLRGSFGDINMPIEEFNAQVADLDARLEDGSLTEAKYSEALEELTLQAYGAEGAEKARAAAQLAGARGMSGLLAIVNATAEDYNDLTEAIYGSSGAADTMAKTMQNNLNGQMTILKSQLQELAISFGDLIIPLARDAVTVVQNIVDKLNNMDEGQRKTILTFAAVAAAAGPVLSIGGRLVNGIGGLLKLAPLVVSGIGSIVGVLGGPLTIAIGAAIAIGVTLYKNWDTIKEKAGQLKDWVSTKWTALKDSVSTTVTNLKTSVSEKWNALKADVEQKQEAMSANLKAKFDSLKSAASTKWSSIKETISSRVRDYVTSSINKNTEMYNVMSEKFSAISNLASEKFSAIKNAIHEKMSAAADVVGNMIERIKGFFNFQWQLPHLALPHFSVSGSINPIDWFTQGVPSISVDWYRKAYDTPIMFTRPTVLQTPGGYKGFGDGTGAEIVMSLNKLREVAGQQNITINVYGAQGQDVSQLAKEVERELVALQQQRSAVWA